VLTAKLISACPPKLRAPLSRYLAGEASAEITLMQFALRLRQTSLVGPLLENFSRAAPECKELAGLCRLAAVNTSHLAQVTILANDGLVNIEIGDRDGVAAIRDQFDRAVALAPEASVALYSLGSSDILDRATAEIVNRLADWELLRSDSSVLDIGCGIGRMERALARRVGSITAIDVSLGMIEEARRRCGDLTNVVFEQCDGRDLARFCDRSFDVVLAVDSFPYLFAADPEIVAQHMRDGARILKPGGAILILNFSYRGDQEADCRDIARLASISRLTVQRSGTRDFTLWDGLSFLLTRPLRRE
jgi:SAM-dependent methyltransferase